MNNPHLSKKEQAVVAKWRRQYRQRWVACGLFGVLAVVGTSVATLVLLQIFEVLSEHNMPLVDIVTLNWAGYLSEATTNRLLFLLSVAAMIFLASAAIVALLVTTFHVGFQRYRVMEKILCTLGYDGVDKE